MHNKKNIRIYTFNAVYQLYMCMCVRVFKTLEKFYRCVINDGIKREVAYIQYVTLLATDHR